MSHMRTTLLALQACKVLLLLAADCLSTKVFKLEMELKSVKASHDAQALHRMQKLHSISAENTAAQMAALIRKAAAAQEAADSLEQQLTHSNKLHAQQMADAQTAVEATQQQLSHSTQVHAQQLADAQASVDSTQQELQRASQSLAQMQQELAAARRMHADCMAELQQEHAVQMATVTTGITNRMAIADSELSGVKASLTATTDQHAKSVAELQERRHSLTHQFSAAGRKHAMMLAASHTELAEASQLNLQQWRSAEQGYEAEPTQHPPQHSHELPQTKPHHFTGLAQSYKVPSASIAKCPSDWADYPHLVALPSRQAEHNSLNHHSSQAAALVADCEAQAASAGEGECRVVRQELTKLRGQLALAQAEILVHTSVSLVRQWLLDSKQYAAEQDPTHLWTDSDQWQQLQLHLHGVAVAVHKRQQADTETAAGNSHSIHQHAVTDSSVADRDYPSDEDELYDWTSNAGACKEDDSDKACTPQTDSTRRAASNSQSIWVSSAAEACSSSSSSSGRCPQSDVQTQTLADTADTMAPQHAEQASVNKEQISSSAAQMPCRSLLATDEAVCANMRPGLVNCRPPVDASGANTGSSSTEAGCTIKDGSCVTTSTAVAAATGSFVDYYESEENDLRDWTCDEDADCARGDGSCVPNHYLSDEDSLYDWTLPEDAHPEGAC